MILSVLIVTFTYVACAFATIVAVKAGPGLTIDGQTVAAWQWIGHHGGEGFGAAVERLLPKWGNVLVVLAVIFASTSALNATIYSATRASYALGRDRMLPAAFSRISSRTQTPWVALMATGGIVVVVAGALDTTSVASSASIMFLLLFFLVNLCVIRVRYNMGDELQYGFLMPLFPLLPVLAIICQGVLAMHLHEMSGTAMVIAIAWIGIGIVFYRTYSRHHAVATEDEIHVLEEERQVPGDEYKVMVAVANPDNALSLVRQTHAICSAREASVELLHMVPVPDQVPLSDASKYMLTGREAITETLLYLSPSFPLSTTVRYCRNVARGIVHAVREHRANLLIMGWRGTGRSRSFALGSTIDPVIERCPCDVAVFKNCGDQRFKRVLVPVAGGPNGAFAIEMASILGERDGYEITVFTVRNADHGTPFDLDAFLLEAVESHGLDRSRIHSKTVQGTNPVEAIIKEATESTTPYDLLVLGGTRERVLAQFTRSSVPEDVARRCEMPLVIVQCSRGIRSWIRKCI